MKWRVGDKAWMHGASLGDTITFEHLPVVVDEIVGTFVLGVKPDYPMAAGYYFVNPIQLKPRTI